jgi:two-component system CheB/CheR fusion protein
MSEEETATAPETPAEDRFPIVGIGASAGGLGALKTFFARVPEKSGAAFVVVVHLSPEYKSHMPELLQPHVKLPVRQVTGAVPLEQDHVYIIPPNANLDTIDTHLRLSALEERRQDRAPIDHFFRTLARTHDGDAIGVILTGTGSDGTQGLRHIKERGGLTVVQDPTEAEYDGMPRSAIAAAPVDLVLPLAQMPEAILRYARTAPRLTVPADEEHVDSEAGHLLHKVFAQIRARTGRDFSSYKRSTVLRRITHRMQFNHLQEPSEYLDLLRRQPDEVHALADDILITVTSFFRDPEVFQGLTETVIPRLFDGKETSDCVRVWSVGCATGEEAYSLAMLLLEESSRREASVPMQIFASDLHKRSLQAAREGFYPGDIEPDITPERLRRFFEQDAGGYRIRKEVRDLVIFTPHNLLGDPPFSRVDLVTCRNLLIYLQRDTQQRVFELFHYALLPGGFLMVGSSETVDAPELFRIEDKKRCVYRKRNVPAPEPRLPFFPQARAGISEWTRRAEPALSASAYDALHQRMMVEHGPPSLLVGSDDKIVHLSARAGRYLVHPAGAPTTSVYKLVRQELQLELRAALPAARAQGKPLRSQPISVQMDGEALPVVLDVRPALAPGHEGLLLVVFEEREPATATAPPADEDDAQRQYRARVDELEAEQQVVRERLQAIIKDYEASQEELKASNEELQSANEELRSMMEELETSKEELQSINEELQTVNQENRHKVEELDRLSTDLQHFLAATDIATLFLDRQLQILRFTPRVGELFNVRSGDRGRPLADFTHSLGYDELLQDATAVRERLTPIEREVQDQAGRWYLTRMLPYRSADDRIGGVVITFVDITARKQAEDLVREAKQFAEHIIETLPEPLLVLTGELRVHSANAAFYEHFQVHPDQTRGRKVYDLGNGQWNIPSLRALLENVLPQNHAFSGYQVEHVFETLGRRVMLLNGRRLDHLQLILLGIHDITERHATEQALRRSEERLQRMVNVEGVGVMIFDDSGTLVDANDTVLRTLGYSRDEIAAGALTWRRMTPPEYVESSEQQLRKLAETGRIGPYEKEYLHKDGSRAWMVFAGASLGDGNTVEYCIDVSDRKRAEKALRDSEERYRALARLSPDALLVYAEGRYVYANEAAARLLGAGHPQVLVGLSPFDLVAPEDHDAVRERLRAVLETQRTTPRRDLRLLRLDGSSVYVEAISGPIDWEQAPAVQVVARDVSERKRAEEALRESQERRYRTLFESIDEGFCVVEVLFDDAGKAIDYRFLEVNPSFEQQTGIADPVGRRMRELVPMHEEHWFETYGQVALTGEPVRFQRLASQLGRFYDVHAFRVGQPEERRVAVLFDDISERKRLEDELRRVASELSQANRRKDEYLAMLGHELRNPLAAIRSATELMKLTNPDDPRLQRAYGVLERQASQMSRLIDGLLDVSRIVQGKVELEREPVDVREVLATVIQDRAAEAEARRLDLRSDLPPAPVWIAGDRLRLAQVFDNLVGNACKFTTAPGTITVTLAAEDEHAVVRVQDTGVGIRPEALAHIFEPFFQESQDMARSGGGLGLGLSLARGLIELHDGTIEARSAGPGRGAELVVRLPLGHTPTEPPPARQVATLRPRRILLVEDNADAAQMLRELLELHGHELASAGTATEALELLRRSRLDLVLCDVGLPGMSGLDFARAVRADASLRHVPLVALTGYGQPEDRKLTAAAGFDAHLTKPIDLHALSEVLDRLAGPGRA